MLNDKQISYNFTIAKIISIFAVLTGHFFTDLPLWAIVSMGLAVFAFSSGYFTAQRYPDGFSIRKFWQAKIIRLLPALFLINLFLLILFCIQGKPNIWTPQSVLAWFGLSTLLQWLGIDAPSPFGNGLWFFTVLLLFYFLYPLICTFCRRQSYSVIFLLAVIGLTTWMEYTLSFGYELALTTLSFAFGVFAARIRWRPSAKLAFILLTGMLVSAVVCYIILHAGIPYWVRAGSALSVIAFLLAVPLSPRIFDRLRPLSGCVLEIYLLHTYLFIHFSDIPLPVNFGLSVLLITLTACQLSRLNQQILKKINPTRQ